MAKGVIHVGKGKSLSSGEARENERRGWTEESYRRKNIQPLNNYDWSRARLNFEILDGKIIPLGSQKVSLYNRYLNVLKDLNFTQYKDGASNQQHTYVELILSGSTERMQQLAFGDQRVDYTRNPPEWKNWGIQRQQAIEEWATDCYNFVCSQYGRENVKGFEVHLDETEPHIHVNLVPTAIKQQRGNISGYHKVNADGTPARYIKGKHVGDVIKISDKKYEQLSDEKKKEYLPNVRGDVRTISYATYFGRTLEERSQKLSQLHTDFYEKVGKKWGLERGDVWALLPEEERRKRGHRTKQQAYAEQQALQAKEEAEKEVNTTLLELRKNEKLIDNLATTISKNINTIAQQEQTKTELQQNIDLMSKISNIKQIHFDSFAKDLEGIKLFVNKDVRERLISPLRNHSRILSAVNAPLTISELEGLAEKETEAVISSIGLLGLSKKEANAQIRAIRTDVQTILFGVVGAQQRKEIAEANKAAYQQIKKELATVYKDAAQFRDMKKEGVTVNQLKQLKETASRATEAENMLAVTGFNKAKDILVNPELDQYNLKEEEQNYILSVLTKSPTRRIEEMQQLLKYASSFRNITAATKAEAMRLAARGCEKVIREQGYDIRTEANKELFSVLGPNQDISNVVDSVTAATACLIFGYMDAATTISEGGGGGGGSSELPKQGDDEKARSFFGRCLQTAIGMHAPKKQLHR